MANRVSIYTNGSGDAGKDGEQKQNLWTSMLESVASGKRLPEKNLLVLGGTPELQRDFLDSISGPEARRNLDRQKTPPVANSFALGYTYYDVPDADQDDTLARVSLYLLSQPSAEFASLIAPLLTPEAIPNTALVILLDWAEPHKWTRQIWMWTQVFGAVIGELGSDEREAMNELMESWKLRGRVGASVNLDGTPAAAGSADGDSSLPQGPGEWSDPLGLPLCVVCQNAQRMEILEKSEGWKEPDFDTVLQYIRTILLRHGASLIYTSQNAPSQLPTLIHSTLGITSLLKRQPLKNNVIDRDKITVPPNWDSWSKIRVLGGSFDAEAVSKGWAEDIQLSLDATPPSMEQLERNKAESRETAEELQQDSAIARYEDWCRSPTSNGLAVVESAMSDGSANRVESEDTQVFLEKQLKLLEVFKAKAQEKLPADVTASKTPRRLDFGDEKSISEHIGPVQFNMGGIQVDADDMLQRLKDRNASGSTPESPSEDESKATPNIADKYNNEELQNFFSGLMNRKGGTTDGPR